MERRPNKPAEGWPIAQALAGLGLPACDPTATNAITTWLDRLSEWNAKIDLTAAKDPNALVGLMIADAAELASAAAAIAPRAAVVDVGTGAGAPGLGLALLRPDLRVTLVEPLHKRVAFLRTLLGELRRTDVTLIDRRGDAVAGGALAGTFDEAVSRATLKPDEWLALGARLVRPGGGVWVLLAQGDAPEHPSCVNDRAIEYTTSAGGKRRLVRFVRRA